MKDLKITKGKWVGVDYAGHYCLQIAPFYGARDLLDENNTHEAEANMMLCCDAGNTAQKCGLLPSELLKQNEELREALKELLDYPIDDLIGWSEGKSVIEITLTPLHIKKALLAITKAE